MSRGSQRVKLEIRRAAAPFTAWVIVVACGLAAVGWVIGNQNSEHPWQKYVTVRAAFTDVKGVLPKKQEVRIAGVRVGLIRDAQIVDGRPVLTLAIERKYAPIYRNARVRLRSQTALEDKYVNLTRGTPSAGRLPSGEILPGTQTSTPVDVSRILQTFDADTRDNLRYLLAGFGKGLSDGGAGLRDAFVQLIPFLRVADQAATQLAVRKHRLADLVTRTGELTRAIGDHDRAITRLVSAGDQTLTTLGRRDTALDPTLRALPGALASIDNGLTTFGRLRAQLDPAVSSLRPAARALQPAMAAVVRASGELQPAASALTPTVARLRPLARDLKPVAGHLAGVAATLRTQVPDADLVTRQFDACHQAFTNFFVYTLSLFKVDSDGQALGRGEVTVGPPITDQRRGFPPEQVGRSKPQPIAGGLATGLKRLPMCTELAGVSTFSSAEGKGR